MNRRRFLKSGALWVPPLFAIGRARGQVLTLADPAMVGRTRNATSASCDSIIQQNDDSANGGGVSTSLAQVRLGVRFQASSSYAICKAGVRITMNETDSDVYIEIRNDATDSVGSLAGTSDAIAGTTIGSVSDTWVEWTFGTPCSVTASSYYWVMIYRPTTSGTNNMSWYYNNYVPEHVVKGDTGSYTDVTTTRATRFRLYGS